MLIGIILDNNDIHNSNVLTSFEVKASQWHALFTLDFTLSLTARRSEARMVQNLALVIEHNGTVRFGGSTESTTFVLGRKLQYRKFGVCLSVHRRLLRLVVMPISRHPQHSTSSKLQVEGMKDNNNSNNKHSPGRDINHS